jgi:hypothetical protein
VAGGKSVVPGGIGITPGANGAVASASGAIAFGKTVVAGGNGTTADGKGNVAGARGATACGKGAVAGGILGTNDGARNDPRGFAHWQCAFPSLRKTAHAPMPTTIANNLRRCRKAFMVRKFITDYARQQVPLLCTRSGFQTVPSAACYRDALGSRESEGCKADESMMFLGAVRNCRMFTQLQTSPGTSPLG